jgi:nitric oxide reductase NorQ protein
MKHYFLRVIWEGTKTRVRPITGQVIEAGATGSLAQVVNPEFNVSCDKEFRSAIPINSIVATDSLKLAPGGMHYLAGQIILMDAPTNKGLAYPIAGSQIFGEFKDVFGMSYDEYKLTGVEPEKLAPVEVDENESRPRTFMSRLESNKKYAPPTIEEDGFHVDTDTWFFSIRAVLRGEPLLYTGPTGCGKTELLNHIGKAFKFKPNFIDMGGMLDGISGLVGVHRIEEGDSIFDYAPFARYVQQPGVIVLDELNRAPITTNNILFPCLDFRRTLPTSLASSKQSSDIELHEDCYLAGTANLGHQYTGTSQLDRALQDRFTEVPLNYMEAEHEELVLHHRSGLDKPKCAHIVRVLRHIRETYNLGELSTTISTRHAIKAANYTNDGIGIFNAMEFAFLPMFEGTKHEGERSLVANIIYAK